MAKISGKFPVSFLQATYLPCWRSQIYGAKRNTIGSCAVTWKFRSVQWTCEVRTGNRGRDPFNQNSNRSDREKRTTSKGGPVLSKLFRWGRTDPLSFGPKFPESLVKWIAPRVYGWVYDLFANVLSRFACELGRFTNYWPTFWSHSVIIISVNHERKSTK